MKKQSKIFVGVIIAVAILAATTAIIVITVSSRSAGAYDQHIQLAQRYVDELQYEQAIIEYEAAIEIDPKREEAYLGLAEIYAVMEDYESAVRVLTEGYAQTKLVEMEERLQEFEVKWGQMTQDLMQEQEEDNVSSPEMDDVQRKSNDVVENSVDEEHEAEEKALPEDRKWIDDLYNDLLSGNRDNVLILLKDPELREKAAPYEYEEFTLWDYETGYKLVTTAGEIVGIVIHEGDDYYDAWAFYCSCEDASSWADYGFDCISSTDCEIHYGFNKSTGKEYYSQLYNSIFTDSEGSVINYNEFEYGPVEFPWHA